MVSYPAGNFLDTAFVASPYPFPILPFDNCSPLGANPLSALGMQITSATSLNATLPLGSPHFSKVDKGKSPMDFVSSEPLPLADSFLPLALMNISHPCPITISPPLSHPAHFTDFLAKWPQPISPRPIIQPSSHFISSDLDPPFSSSVGPCRTTSTVTHLPYNSIPDHSLCSFGDSPMQSLGFGSTLTSVRPLVPSPVLFPSASSSLPYSPLLPVSTLIDSPPLKLTGNSHRLSRFHPYVNPTTLSITQPPSLSSCSTSSPPCSTQPVSLALGDLSSSSQKRKWPEIDDIPLAVLKKMKGQHLFPGFMSNIELAAISLTSLKDGSSSPETLWSVSQNIEELSSAPASVGQASLPLPVRSSPAVDTPVTSQGSVSASTRPLRRFSRATRGLDIYSSMMAAHQADPSVAPDLDQQAVVKGVDQEGLPPQQ